MGKAGMEYAVTVISYKIGQFQQQGSFAWQPKA